MYSDEPPRRSGTSMGYLPSWSTAKPVKPMPIWRRLLRQAAWRERALAETRAERSRAARMAMMLMTTSNSIKLKALWVRFLTLCVAKHSPFRGFNAKARRDEGAREAIGMEDF